jgi:N-acetylmuramoyl-L-alanine amidase
MRVILRRELARIVPVAAVAAVLLLVPTSLAPVGLTFVPVVTVEVKMSYALSPDCLAALCIFAEARGEPFEGQVAVGSVVRNRMARRYASDGTVAGTVFRARQFSWADTGDAQRVSVFQCQDEDPRFLKALAAWRASEYERPVENAILYHAEYVTPPWATAETVRLIRKVGRHLFYDENKG